uniref:UDENN domain-containing protein n=1 Tax=Periophthalmus magnuspinnatus TaxID=409849 RepID=A0A3B3ZDS1_9GOBI
LCFPGGLQVMSEPREEQFHFLVFTDVFGNKTFSVVMQCFKTIVDDMSQYPNQNGAGSPKLFSAFSFCVISKYPFFTALKDSLSCFLPQLRSCRVSDLEDRVKEFAAKLALVPAPPPGHLHLVRSIDEYVSDHDPCVQVLSCLLQEQRVVLFSTDWARLTLVAECLLLFLWPLSWQHPYVPVLARSMLDFLMAPTAFLMGCHISHFEEVASETDDLVLINLDNGSVSTSCSETVNLPEIPGSAAECFTQRCQSLQTQFDLSQCHSPSSTDINEHRAQRRTWQQTLNHDIQRISLELIVNIFRDVCSHLNYEHRVFNSAEFLKTREPNEQLFYTKVLETHIFHSFLKDRLNKKMDSFARMELNTLEVSRRPTMQEIQARRRSSATDHQLKRQGMSLPNLSDHQSFQRTSLLHKIIPDLGLSSLFFLLVAFRTPPKPAKIFKLPDFPASLSFHSVQGYYLEIIQQLNKAIFSAQHENSALLARFYYLRGLINTLCSRRLDALSDFQSLYKTDTAIFPTALVTWLVDSLHRDERQQADRRPELKRLILKVKTENEKTLDPGNDHVKKFELPRKPLSLEEFVRCVQECGIVKDVATIHRLFGALTDGQSKQVDPDLFRDFYTFWKETEAEAQDVNLPSDVIEQLDYSECVYKLSSCVKTSHGVGKIAMTQKRLFLLPEGRANFLEITKFRDIQEVKVSSAPFLLLRIPSLRIKSSSRPEVFEANLKTETELWNLIVKEMWTGRKMADQHKDPQYMNQALTNVLLMDAVVGSQQTQKSISAASKLAYFDTLKHDVPMMVPKVTSETLKHKINPSQDLPEPQTVHVLLYTPGNSFDSGTEMNPKLWVALSGGRVVVFDATSWSILQDCIMVGECQLNCMLGLVQEQVWIGSKDSVIYIIDTHSMSCNKQLTEHRQEVTGLAVDTREHKSQAMYSCSCDGTILLWDSISLKVKRQFYLSCSRLSSIQIHDGSLWCGECQKLYLVLIIIIIDLKIVVFPAGCVDSIQGQLWTGCADSGDLFVFSINSRRSSKRITLPGNSGVTCMIQVKSQVSIWVGCRAGGDHGDGQGRSQVLVLDSETHEVDKELQAHTDSTQTLCSAEGRYVLSGSARGDGKIAIWKVE